jgi:arylsulfatase A-like enzyme
MAAQYSIRNASRWSLFRGQKSTLSAHAYTMADMFHGLGYATAIFGKWHLGGEPQSLPTVHGFDEF